MTYQIMFETENGMEIITMIAKHRRDAIEELKRQYPNDIGADGVIQNHNGDEFPLNW